jgi:hypothetical protein
MLYALFWSALLGAGAALVSNASPSIRVTRPHGEAPPSTPGARGGVQLGVRLFEGFRFQGRPPNPTGGVKLDDGIRRHVDSLLERWFTSRMRPRWLVPLVAVLAAALLLAGYHFRAAALAPAPAVTATTPSSRPPIRPARRARGRAMAPGLAPLRGRVVGARGEVVPRAEIRVRAAGSKGEAVAEVEADEQGGFEAFVAPHLVVITATAPGFAEGTAEVEVPGPPITIKLRRGARLIGRVVRADTRTPVAGAGVEAGENPKRAREGAYDDPVYTDVEGRFVIDSLPAGRFKPVAHGEGLFGQAAVSVTLGTGETSAEVLVALHPVATLTGRLELATTAEACAGGRVELISGDGLDVVAVADGRGELRFPALLPGSYEPRLTCPGHAERESAPSIEVGDEPLATTFRVHDHLTIRGIVVDRKGDPLPYLKVQAGLVTEHPVSDDDDAGADWMGSINSTSAAATTLTDEEGRFVLYVPGPERYQVATSGWGNSRTIEPAWATVTGDPPGPDVRVVVERLHVCRGRVVDQRGVPMPRHTGVTARILGGGSHGGDVEEDGWFVLRGLEPGPASVSVSVGTSALPILRGDVDDQIPCAREWLFVVDAPVPNIDGLVVGGGPGSFPAEIELSNDTQILDATLTDAQGRFEVRAGACRACSLKATTPRGETAEVSPVGVGQHPTLHLRAFATLRGTLAGGIPRAFSISLPDLGREERFVDTHGSWELRDVPAGGMYVEASAGPRTGKTEIIVVPGEIRVVSIPLAAPDDDGPEEGSQ